MVTTSADSLAVRVNGLSKKFRIHHERNQYLKTALLKGSRSKHEDFWALRNVSFDVHKGEAFGIIGHNGSGKSTLLKCLTGILRPDEGNVVVNGTVAALLELGAGFHPELSGKENIFLNAAILGVPRKEIADKFEAIVEFAGLERFIDTPVKNYSSGMYVRLGFAVMINVDPDVLIFDEILAVGDAEFQAKCRDKIAEFRERNKTIILVTHGMSDVVSLCDRAAWIDHGTLRGLDKPNEIVDEYMGVSREGRKVAVSDGTRWGSGEARVSRIEVLDIHREPTDFARTGEPLVFRLHYEAFKPVPNAIFGLSITHHQTGLVLFGTNQRRLGISIPMLDGVGYVDYVIDRLPLIDGSYDLSVAINDWTEQREMDYWQKPLQFEVHRGLQKEEGFMTVFGRWESEVVHDKYPRNTG